MLAIELAHPLVVRARIRQPRLRLLELSLCCIDAQLILARIDTRQHLTALPDRHIGEDLRQCRH